MLYAEEVLTRIITVPAIVIVIQLIAINQRIDYL